MDFKKLVGNFEISIKSLNEDENISIKVEGTKIALMNALAQLVTEIEKNTNLTKEDIKYAMNLGLKTDEELSEETEVLFDKVMSKMKEIFTEEDK